MVSLGKYLARAFVCLQFVQLRAWGESDRHHYTSHAIPVEGASERGHVREALPHHHFANRDAEAGSGSGGGMTGGGAGTGGGGQGDGGKTDGTGDNDNADQNGGKNQQGKNDPTKPGQDGKPGAGDTGNRDPAKVNADGTATQAAADKLLADLKRGVSGTEKDYRESLDALSDEIARLRSLPGNAQTDTQLVAFERAYREAVKARIDRAIAPAGMRQSGAGSESGSGTVSVTQQGHPVTPAAIGTGHEQKPEPGGGQAPVAAGNDGNPPDVKVVRVADPPPAAPTLSNSGDFFGDRDLFADDRPPPPETRPNATLVSADTPSPLTVNAGTKSSISIPVAYTAPLDSPEGEDVVERGGARTIEAGAPAGRLSAPGAVIEPVVQDSPQPPGPPPPAKVEANEVSLDSIFAGVSAVRSAASEGPQDPPPAAGSLGAAYNVPADIDSAFSPDLQLAPGEKRTGELDRFQSELEKGLILSGKNKKGRSPGDRRP